MKFCKQLFIALALCLSFQATANEIKINIDESEFTLGEQFDVEIELADLDFFDTFEFYLSFDASIFEVVMGTDSTTLPNDGVDNLFDFFASPGEVGFSFLSFVNSFDGSYLINFSMEAIGTTDSPSELFLDVEVFEDVFAGEVLTIDSTATKSLTVNAVPIPTLAGMIGLATLLLVGRHRQQSK
ncbi:cohesin domain-containing protein [Glaciecola sp. KUL10]|uniref:cohesin domain-containing protein n=1 Tax=Glaciecola sp. (strain KUL10) TaxID=2161813 RepID=UPI000D789579|nr:cohesin domain-containing protein [Glaciecola sp. KUL10]GBL03737.1 cellulose binding domain-containing protein [Glaciecola sp. KUL10]